MEEQVRRAIDGDTDAFLELMKSTDEQMYKTAWSILKEDADVADAVQNTIIACYEKIGTLRNPGLFRTWIMRILINECYKLIKHRKRNVAVDEEKVQSIPAGKDGMEQMRFKELLSLADEKYHLMLTLYYADEYSVKEIAKILDLNENTVKTRLARAREQIRRGLNEDVKFSYGC